MCTHEKKKAGGINDVSRNLFKLKVDKRQSSHSDVG